MSMSTPRAATAAMWMTDHVEFLFIAEITNEVNGGVSPATLDSTIDSISQAPDIMCEGWGVDDFVSLLMIVSLMGLDCEVGDLLGHS